MKTMLTGLFVAGITCLALDTSPIYADKETTAGQYEVVYQPVPTTGNDLVEVASTSVLGPQRVTWNRDGSGLYIVNHEGVFFFDPIADTLESLLAVAPSDFVLDVSPDGIVALMLDTGTLILRDLDTGTESAPLVEGADISSASFSPDGSVLALVLTDGSWLQLWDVASAQLTSEYTSPSLAEGAYSVSFSPDGESLTWYSVMGGQQLDLASGEFGPFVSFRAPIYDVQMCAGNALVVATRGGLSVWDAATASLTRSDDDFQAFSNSCAPSGDSLLITTDAQVGLLAMPSLSGGQWIAEQAVDAEFAPSGSRFAIVGAGGEIAIWEPR